MALQLTPSQTVGPYFSIGMTWADGAYVVPPGTPGAIWLRGSVLDGNGEPIPDAVVESWQADREGRFAHPEDPRGGTDFRGFARAPTDREGRFGILTLKPGPVPGPNGATQAPHMDLSVFARGLLNRVVTRVYFADEADANAGDPVLAVVEPSRRPRLVAAGDEASGYRFDICLQGEDESVFFEC